MKSGIPRSVFVTIGLVALLGLWTGDSALWGTLALAGMLLLGGLYWLFNQRLPSGFVRNLFLILAGPGLVLVLMNIALTQLRTLPDAESLILLFAIAVLLLWLGHRWRRSGR